MKEIEAIRDAMASLKPEVRVPWRTLDHLPYIHATDDPNAKPYSTPVVGRFDYLETAEYILACNPAAMTAILAHIDSQQAEIERLQAAFLKVRVALGLDLHGNEHLLTEIGRMRADATKWQELRELRAQLAGRFQLQAEGKHPAPCALHCEANAFGIEIRTLKRERGDLVKAVRGLLNALPSATTHPAIRAAKAAIAELEDGEP